MKLVTQTANAGGRFGDLTAVRMICEAGFDGIDYSLFHLTKENCTLMAPCYEQRAKKLLEIASFYGKTFEQTHAPFPTVRPGDSKYNTRCTDAVRRCFEICAILGIKVCVMHPDVLSRTNRFDRNVELFTSLLPYAKEYGVNIALENLYGGYNPFSRKRVCRNTVCSTPQALCRLVDALDADYFSACVDVGHCRLVGVNPARMIRTVGGKRLTALHIHDNDFKFDRHVAPYQGKINWSEVLEALAEIDYKGNFTFEADNFLKPLPNDAIAPALKYLNGLGRCMIDEFTKYKTEKEEIK